MDKNKKNIFFLTYILKFRQQMLQFHLLKFLKIDDFIKLQLLSKDGGQLVDTNNLKTVPNFK